MKRHRVSKKQPRRLNRRDFIAGLGAVSAVTVLTPAEVMSPQISGRTGGAGS
jgi:hypothetical protein